MQVLLVHKTQQSGFTVQPSCSFGDLKATAGMQFGLPEDSFKLLFRGREKADTDLLIAAGVKSGAKIQVAETAAYRQSQPDPTVGPAQPDGHSVPSSWTQFGDNGAAPPQPSPSSHQQPSVPQQPADPQAQSLQAIRTIAQAVDGLEQKAHPFLSSPVGQPLNQYELRSLIEQLTQQLFKLDTIEGGGDIRTARKSQIARIEGLADALERLKS